MQELVLIRGLPGSGKSTTAIRDYPRHRHVEADQYFLNAEGDYIYNPNNLKDAHAWCQRLTQRGLECGDSVTVSNTFTQTWEMEPYLCMAEALNVPVRIIECDGIWDNVHGVPPEVIEKMRARWEPFDLRTWAKSRCLEILAEACENDDRELDHMNADAAVERYLRVLGETEVADAYRKAVDDKWYA